MEDFDFWWRVVDNCWFFVGKSLKIGLFLWKNYCLKSDFGVVFLEWLYYNVDRSGVKWFFVEKNAAFVDKWGKVVTAKCFWDSINIR